METNAMTDDDIFPESHSVTVLAALVVLLSWIALAELAGGGDNISQYLTSRSPIGNLLIFFLSPILHQGLEYVLGNLLILLAVGPFVESRMGRQSYAEFSIAAGVGLSILAVALSHPTVGYSGITYALTGREFTSTITDGVRRDGSLNRFLIISGILLFQLVTIAGDGTSVVAHAGGLVVGAASATSAYYGYSIKRLALGS